MMNPKISKIILIITTIIFVFGFLYIVMKKGEASQNLIIGTHSDGVVTPLGSYTLGEVSIHNSKLSCWTSIKGEVYDVTSFINKHPGGQNPILGLCGKDGTSAFSNQHGTQPRPSNELARFIIGTLKK